MNQESNNTERWHLKKEIQLGHLLTTITVAVAAVMYINKIDQRVSVLEVQVLAQRDASTLLRGQLDKINDKLDRLIERGQK